MTSRLPRNWSPQVARAQGGVFTARQAILEGMTAAQVRRRRDTGIWRRVAGSALALDGTELDAWARVHAAWLTWPDGVACLTTAATAHRLPVPADPVLHVVVPDHRRPRLNLQGHRVPLASADVVRIGQAQVTTHRRTIVDCLGWLPEAAADGLVAWSLTRGHLTHADLEASVEAQRGRRGNPRRRRVVEETRNGALGPAERRLHELLRGAHLSGWCANERVVDGAGIIGRADVLFPAERLVIEVDGFEFHGREKFQADRDRQNRLVGAGYTVLRFTWSDLTRRPDAVVRQVVAALTRLRAEVGRRG
ncbi:type IV toxin-antitoxin system AbiEi family antitoxin domain-containing protein [Cellulomonas fimi]|uniref:DUF559 domain-containing protein n=1 Tax=Cellulomonas fimi TaxID=1708 RepID=A0A7Y0QHG3_CELFI|nr:type IV toxin-antitoxin system AbiEi family antitoxin domain-containing protein [Cellulomonas fimi]NMR20148.1 DUF559 domain-containing protein [Cellulomonas fimi]